MIRYSKINWDCTLIKFTMDNLTILTFNWDCTLIKSEDANKLSLYIDLFVNQQQ